MFFKDLTRAINRLATSVYSLAVAIRGEVEVPEPSPEAQEAQFDKIIEAIKATEAKITPNIPSNKPLGAVFYANDESYEREDLKEEVLEYLEQRGYGVEARAEVETLLGKVD